MQKREEVKQGFHEEECEHCDGCGLVAVRDPKRGQNPFGVTMCQSCNGHGVQLVANTVPGQRPQPSQYHVYDKDETMRKRLSC